MGDAEAFRIQISSSTQRVFVSSSVRAFPFIYLNPTIAPRIFYWASIWAKTFFH